MFVMHFLDSSTEFLFGESANTLLPKFAKLDAEQFLTSFDKAMTCVDRRMALAGVSFLYGRATQDAEWRQAIAQVHGFVDIYVDRALTDQAKASATANIEGGKGSEKGVSGTVDVMLEARTFSVVSELVKETTDRKFLRDQLISLFFPSRDATGIGLSDLFFNLARHPRVWTTVCEEMMASLGPEQPLTFENLKSLRYLQSVLNESMREPYQCPNRSGSPKIAPVSFQTVHD
jgi:hypothetical protein